MTSDNPRNKNIKDELKVVHELKRKIDFGRIHFYKKKSSIFRLIIRGTNLTELPKEILHLSGLRDLFIENNQLMKFPEWIGKLNNLEYIEASGNIITHFPEEFSDLKSLIRLDCSFNPLKDVKNLFSKGLSNLSALILNNTGLKQLPSEIANLKLTKLYLNGNYLKDLPTSISEINTLLDLRIEDNKLREFPAEIMFLKNLDNLSLNNNELKSVPCDILELPHLRHLSLSGNHLNSFQIDNIKSDNFSFLDISANEFKTLPHNISNLFKLNVFLNLSGNPWEHFPDLSFPDEYKTSIGNNGTLIILDICYWNKLLKENRNMYDVLMSPMVDLTYKDIVLDYFTDLIHEGDDFGTISRKIKQASMDKCLFYSLEHKFSERIDLGAPHYTKFSSALLNLLQDLPIFKNINRNIYHPYPGIYVNNDRIFRLDLNSKHLKHVPKDISNIDTLEELVLRLNLLKSLPGELGGIDSLKYLDLSRNNFFEVPPSVFSLENLEYLNLSYNNLVDLPETIENLQNLKRLDLSNNRMRSLPAGIQNLEHLELLNVSDNYISDISSFIDFFKGGIRVDLSHNYIEELPKELQDRKNISCVFYIEGYFDYPYWW
ncbi:MAG: hypothetical protein GF364_05730 [Candidatus Lokiarchaeota archaeon]|nr:hypothetical protein [Candidatus Lokiarchaeota archaeon]